MDYTVLEDLLHNFVYKWKKYLDLPRDVPNEANWKILSIHLKEYYANIVQSLLKPTYNYLKHERIIMEVPYNHEPMPDLEVCKSFLYADDKILIVKKFRDRMNDSECYAIISHMGSFITRMNEIWSQEKFGTSVYPDIIIEIIKNLKNIDSINTLIIMLKELDHIQYTAGIIRMILNR